MKQKLTDGNESSDSDDLYEDPVKQNEGKVEENGEQVHKNQIYCMEFRK